MFEMTLFDTGDLKKDLKIFKSDLKEYAKRLDIELPRSFPVTFGNPDSIGKNILVITEPITKRWFKSKEILTLQNFLPDHFEHFFITSCYLLPKERVSRKDIKNFSTWVTRLASLIQPRMVVALGEDAEYSFVRRKAILKENHGKEICTWNGLPVYLTYPMSYYSDRSEYEDTSYKDFIKTNDWISIKERFDALAKPKRV